MCIDSRLLREPKTRELRTISNVGLKTQNTVTSCFAELKIRDPKTLLVRNYFEKTKQLFAHTPSKYCDPRPN